MNRKQNQIKETFAMLTFQLPRASFYVLNFINFFEYVNSQVNPTDDRSLFSMIGKANFKRISQLM